MQYYKNIIFTICLVLLPVLLFELNIDDIFLFLFMIFGMGGVYPILLYNLKFRSASILALGTLGCILVYSYCDIFIPRSGFFDGGFVGFIFIIIFAPPYLIVTIIQYFLNKPSKKTHNKTEDTPSQT